jgi:hypothetical protein
VSVECAACRQAADDDALTNWLDAHNRRSPHPTWADTWVYDELTAEEWAEVAEWADLLMDNAEEYWHHYHAV